MSLLNEEKRREAAAALKAFQTQALNAINQIKGIKTNLTNLQNSFDGDPVFDASDVADAQTIIDEIDVEVGKI